MTVENNKNISKVNVMVDSLSCNINFGHSFSCSNIWSRPHANEQSTLLISVSISMLWNILWAKLEIKCLNNISTFILQKKICPLYFSYCYSKLKRWYFSRNHFRLKRWAYDHFGKKQRFNFNCCEFRSQSTHKSLTIMKVAH